MLARRLQVLPDRQDVHVDLAQVAHHLDHLFKRLAQPDHDAALGDRLGPQLFGVGQGRDSPLVMILRLDVPEQALDRLDVVVQDVGSRVHDDLERVHVALEIRDEHLNSASRLQLTDAFDALGKDGRAAVLAFVPVDGRDDHVSQAHRLHRLGHTLRLLPVNRFRATGGDVAKATRTGANVAQDEKRSSAMPPTLADVGAMRLLTNGVQRLAAHQALDVAVGLARRGLHL